MSQPPPSSIAALPDSFGPALRFLRKRARLTQDELGRAVGYSREQIARLENGSRLPDLAVIAALFVPALWLERERGLMEQFLALAGRTRQGVQVTLTHTRETRIQLIEETDVEPARPLFSPPAPLLPLLGRRSDVEAILARLDSDRLLTIVGAPGIGKTRLALEVANIAIRQPAGQFPDGAVFVSLAEAQTAADIPYALLRHLSLTPSPQQSPADAVVEALWPRRMLVVLDNCEHLVDGIDMLAGWLAAAPGLKLLCTSRVALDLYGEHEWPLSPLAVPDLAEPPDLERWGSMPSMQLVVARASAADPEFALTADNLLPLATLCVALDGLPLALELAAVRLRDLSPLDLVQQLLLLRGHVQLSSTWLHQTRRNIAERHRTLQAAIGWSTRLLDSADQAVFHRLGVFVGGCTGEAAEQIAGADSLTLARLARASLIQIDNGRVRLLETLGSYAREQLTGDEQQSCYRDYTAFYARFAGEVFNGLIGDDQTAWMARALADHDNCLSALRRALAEEAGDTAVAIAGGLWWFWYRRGLFALGRDLLAAALRLPSGDPSARARALNGLASFYLVDENFEANLACHEEGLALRRRLNDPEGISTALHNMGLTAIIMGDYARAMDWLDESVTVFPDGDQTSAWAHMGLIAQETLDMPGARHWLQLAYEGAMATSNGWMQAFVMNYLADVLRELGEFAEATRLARESMRLFTDLEDTYYLPDAQLTLAQIALNQGDIDTAAALAAQAGEQYEAREDAAYIASVLLVQAELARVRGCRDEAIALMERSSTLRHSTHRAVSPRERAEYERLALALNG